MQIVPDRDEDGNRLDHDVIITVLTGRRRVAACNLLNITIQLKSYSLLLFSQRTKLRSVNFVFHVSAIASITPKSSTLKKERERERDHYFSQVTQMNEKLQITLSCDLRMREYFEKEREGLDVTRKQCC
jgi:hypothetical protein